MDNEGRPVMVIVGAHFLLRCLDLERFILHVVKVKNLCFTWMQFGSSIIVVILFRYIICFSLMIRFRADNFLVLLIYIHDIESISPVGKAFKPKLLYFRNLSP